MSSSFARLHKLSIPIYFSYLIGVLFHFADNAIIGRYNIESYAVVTVIGSVMYYIIGSIGTFSLALSLNGASLLEKKHYKRYEDLFNTTIVIGLILSFLLIPIFYTAGGRVLNIFFSEEVTLNIATDYLEIILFCIPLNLLIFTFSSYFKTVEKPQPLVYASTFSSLVNIVVNYILVFGHLGFPRMGASGIAIGTLTGLTVSLVFYLYYFIKQTHIRIRLRFSKIQATKILKSFTTLFIQDLFEFTIFYFFLLAVISSSGSVNAAIYGVLSTIFSLLVMYSYSYGNTLLIIARKESNNPTKIVHLLRICIIAFVLVYALFTLIIYITDTMIPALITNYDDILKGSTRYILIFSVSQVFIGVSTIMRYYLNGIGFEKYVLKTCCLVCTISGTTIYAINYLHSQSFNWILILFAVSYAVLTVVFTMKIISELGNNTSIQVRIK